MHPDKLSKSFSQLPTSVIRLTTVSGFIKSYKEKLSVTKSCKEAYEAANEEYRILFGSSRYSTYGTFRNTLSRWNKKRIKHLKLNKCKKQQ